MLAAPVVSLLAIGLGLLSDVAGTERALGETMFPRSGVSEPHAK